MLIPIRIILITGVLYAIISGIATADKKNPKRKAFIHYNMMLGDFDEMAQHRRIRALVTYSKTFYFFDR